MNKSEIIRRFFFKPNKQFSEPVEKRVRNLYYPSASLEVRIPFDFHLFFSARANMRYVFMADDCFSVPCKSCVKTQILWFFVGWKRTKNDDVFKRFLQQPDIVDIGSVYNDRQRYAFSLGKYASLNPIFSPCLWDLLPQLHCPTAISSYNRQDSATPTLSLSAHRIHTSLLSIIP